MKKKYYIYGMKSGTLTVMSFVLLAIMFLLTVLLKKELVFSSKDFNIAMLFMIPYLILHELLHSLAYVIHGADFKNITYGAHIEKGILCCLCKQNVTKRNILTSLLYPFIFIGVITFIIGILLNNVVLIWLSILNISGCSGDLVMFFDLLKLKDFEYSEFDNPMAFGIYSEEDLSKTKLFGLEFIEVKDKLDIKDLKKVTVSKVSVLAFVLFTLLCIVNIFL